MSFSREGVPLAAENNPRLLFESLFQDDSASARVVAQKRYAEDRSILDLVQDNTRALHWQPGRNDQRKLDEYLTSVRAVETQVRRSESWLNVPKPKVDGGMDRFYLEQLAYFMRRLKAVKEMDGTMLDHTLIVYGSGMNNGERGGHFSTNLPILFAGGRNLGINQGQRLAFKQPDHKLHKERASAPPLSNLFYTILEHLETPVKAFADCTGRIAELCGRAR